MRRRAELGGVTGCRPPPHLGDAPTYYIRFGARGGTGRTERAPHSLEDEQIEFIIFDLYRELARRTIQRARTAALPRVPLIGLDTGRACDRVFTKEPDIEIEDNPRIPTR